MKLIKFSAEWCQPCKLQRKEFENNPLINVDLIEIDVDEDIDNLTEKYKIMSIPTLILVDDKENIINKWIGFTKSETITKYIDELK